MNEAVFTPLIGLLITPLIWATFAFILGPKRSPWIAISGLAIQSWFSFELARQVSLGVSQQHAVGSWGAPLGIDLAVDGLSAAMLVLTQIVAFIIAIYSRSYFKPNDAAAVWFWPLFGFLISGLNALFISADLFNIYVTLELVGLSAIGLVAAGGGKQQITAALRYLFATLIGSSAYLLGVALLYGSYGTVSISTLQPLITQDAPQLVLIACGLMIAGLLIKTALFPFHFWLPAAHGSAAAPISALLSALVVKASFYLVLRLYLGPLEPVASHFAWLLAILGCGAIFWGSWQAIRAAKLKRLIAYSTVAQLGYLFLSFPLLAELVALQAVTMQIFAHGLAKAGMFVAAGILIKATGEDTVAGLAGAVERLPITMFAMGLSGITLMGLPPSAGFLAKWLMIDAALTQGYWMIAFVVLAGGLLAAVYVFRILRQAFLLAPPHGEMNPVPRKLEWCAFTLSAASVILGLRGVELMHLVGVGL